MGEIATFTEIFRSYSMSQLNELLEDNEKLNKIVTEMDEVSNLCLKASKQLGWFGDSP